MLQINKDIIECNKNLNEAKIEKEYKINCEEVAKMINVYDSKEQLEENIRKLEEENKIIDDTDKLIMDKLNVKSGKLSLLVKLIDDLKSNFDEDLERLNKLNKDNNKMNIE